MSFQQCEKAAAKDATVAAGPMVGAIGDEDDQQPGDSNTKEWEVSDDEEEVKSPRWMWIRPMKMTKMNMMILWHAWALM